MTRYQVTGKLVLSFIVDEKQVDFLIEDGVVEIDGHDIWYVNASGRFESTSTVNIVDIGLGLGCLRQIAE